MPPLSLATTRAAGLSKGLMWPPSPGAAPAPYQLEIIGFDACLMSMYEVASVVQPYSKYLYGSELLEPGDGWDYTALGNITTSGSAMSAAQVAAALTSAYMRLPATGLTQALTDLRALQQLQRELLAAARALKAALGGPNGNSERPDLARVAATLQARLVTMHHMLPQLVA